MLDSVQTTVDSALEDDATKGVFRVARDIFTDPEVFELEMRHIFEGNWIYLAHESQIPNNNDYFTTKMGRQPIFIARNRQGELNAFVNACSHRGAMLCRHKRGSKATYTGTSIHLAGALFADLAGLTLEHVPYRGSAPAVTDLVAGRVDMMFDSVTSAGPHIASGRLVALAVTTSQRIASFPDLPTMTEAGVPGAVVDPWFAMLAPRALPIAARPSLSALLSRLLADPAIAERLTRIGAEPMKGDAGTLARLLTEETARWGAFIQRAGIKAE